MALISRKHRFLFIMAPRTACTAVGNALTLQLAAELLPAKDILRSDGTIEIPAKHTRLAQLLKGGIITPEERQGLFVFTTVRNPFDSLLSLYLKKSRQYQHFLADKSSWVYRLRGYAEDMDYCRTHSFEEWVLKNYWPPWWQRVRGERRRSMNRPYADGADFVMRFETLQQDFDSALQQIGITERIEVPRINPTSRRDADYRSHYSQAARRAVAYTFHHDLQNYGYSF